MTDLNPTANEAENVVKRMSTGATISDQVSATSSNKDDKVLKMATFSLQKYLKVINKY